MTIEDAVAVYSATNNVEVALVCNLLANEGIEAKPVEDVSYVGMTGLGLLPQIHKPQVWVSRRDADQARAILEKYEQWLLERVNAAQASADAATLEAVCEECGRSSMFPASLKGSVQDCPHCGQTMDVEPPMANETWWTEAEAGGDGEQETEHEGIADEEA